MSLRHYARAIVALTAAYVVALQAILLATGTPIAGARELGALPICSTRDAGHSAPAGHGQDCLGACLVGCCFGAPVCSAPGSTAAYLPAPLQAMAIVIERSPVLYLHATRAHRSRAPPLA